MEMVDFQSSWGSLNWCQDVKSKMSLFSEIPKYLKKENTWRFYQGLLLCKSRENLIVPSYRICGHLLLKEILFMFAGESTEGNKHIQEGELFALVSNLG